MRKPGAPRPERPCGHERDKRTGRAAASPTGGELQVRAEPAVARGSLEVFGRRRHRGRAAGTPATSPARDRVVSTGLTDRLAERRRAVRALRLRRARAVLIAVAIVAGAVWALGFSPLLALRTPEVTVQGSDGTVTEAEVREVLAAHEGTSLLRLNAAQLGQEVADSLLRVRTASVSRSWPHGLAVTIAVRLPVAVMQSDSGYDVLDADAVILETVDTPPPDLVLISASQGDVLGPHQITQVAQAVGALDDATRAQVAGASITATGQISLQLISGSLVRWGDFSQAELKAAVLATLLTQPAGVYDVSSPHSPTTS